MKKNNYSRLEKLQANLDEARKELKKIAQIRIGIISGGPSAEEENAEFEYCAKALVSEVKKILKNNGRISKIREVVGFEVCTDKMLRDAEHDKEYSRYIKRQAGR